MELNYHSLKRFEGKIAFITGATKGIGKAIALRLASEGANIAVGFLTNRADAKAAVEEIEAYGVRALAVRGNIANPDHLDKMFAKIDNEFGGLDIFVSNAAVGAMKPAMEITEKDWQVSIDSIATVLLRCAQRAVPLMEKRGGGRIIGMSSLGAPRVMKNYAAIGAAKAAMESTIRYLAMELYNRNIHVNAISAGVADTTSLSMFPNRDEIVSIAKASAPSGRLTVPEDISGVASFLCSEDANWIVGQTIFVDGGISIRS